MTGLPRRALLNLDRPHYDMVVMGGSLGGLAALRQIVRALPASFGAPVVVVLHRLANSPDLLVDLLSQEGGMRVLRAEVGVRPADGVVYTAPTGSHLRLTSHRRFAFDTGGKIEHVTSAADPLFASAAAAYGSRLLAVVLTGRGRDGAEGVRAVAAAGGTVLVEDPATAREPSMPQAALDSGAVHFVCPLDRMSAGILSLMYTDHRSSLPTKPRRIVELSNP